MKTIYNTFVVMESQEQCDRMKQLCIDNLLSIWEDKTAFSFESKENCFEYCEIEFYVTSCNIIPETLNGKTQITIKEFIELLKTTK
jgi:hypothetical protein